MIVMLFVAVGGGIEAPGTVGPVAIATTFSEPTWGPTTTVVCAEKLLSSTLLEGNVATYTESGVTAGWNVSTVPAVGVPRPAPRTVARIRTRLVLEVMMAGWAVSSMVPSAAAVRLMTVEFVYPASVASTRTARVLVGVTNVGRMQWLADSDPVYVPGCVLSGAFCQLPADASTVTVRLDASGGIWMEGRLPRSRVEMRRNNTELVGGDQRSAVRHGLAFTAGRADDERDDVGRLDCLALGAAHDEQMGENEACRACHLFPALAMTPALPTTWMAFTSGG